MMRSSPKTFGASFEKDEIIKPGFDKVTCETHFKNTMKHTNHHKSFEFPAQIIRISSVDETA